MYKRQAVYCREWKKQRLLVGNKWEGGNKQFLFHTGYGKPYHPNTPTNWWRDFLKKNGIRHVKLHGLRHTSATFLLENGATIEAVKDRLGHTSQRSTEIYLHTTKAMEKLAAQKFDQMCIRDSSKGEVKPAANTARAMGYCLRGYTNVTQSFSSPLGLSLIHI